MNTDSLRLSPVQALRKLALAVVILGLVATFAVTRSMNFGPIAHEGIEQLGLILIAICIVGRCWCSLYIGGRKISELVRIGPYSLCRNPLYTFSILGSAGAFAQGGSLTVAALAGLVTWLVFHIVVRKEERLLTALYGEAYLDYLRTTPRFMPNFSRWSSPETIETRPLRLAMTLFDGLAFLLAIPFAEGFEHLQDSGILPVLLHLP